MLYSIDTQSYIKNIPHKRDYLFWINKLSPDELQAIKNELNRRIREEDIHTSSWIPGADWRGTVFHPIYEKACCSDEKAAGMCFGLILWDVLMERENVWGFGRYEKGGVPIKGITYFLIRNPPSK